MESTIVMKLLLKNLIMEDLIDYLGLNNEEVAMDSNDIEL